MNARAAPRGRAASKVEAVKCPEGPLPSGAPDDGAQVPPPPSEPVSFESGLVLGRLSGMLRIRRMEEKSAELHGLGKIRGFLHLYIGEEAIAAGMMPALQPQDSVVAVHQVALGAVETVRSGLAPMFLELGTYRFRAHSMFDAELYRDKAEVEAWKTRGPIHTYAARLKALGMLTEQQFLEFDRQAGEEVDRAVAFAEAGQWEPVEDLLRDVVAAGFDGAGARGAPPTPEASQ